MNKKTFNWFTYYDDAQLLVYSVKQIKKNYTGARLVVWQDSKAPLPQETIEALKDIGAEVYSTFFERNGNLNGEDCIRGELRCMQKTAIPGGKVYKIDSDCIIRDSTPIEEYNKDDVDCLFFYINKLLVYGMGAFYCIKENKLEGLLSIDYRRFLKNWPNHPEMPEDRFVYSGTQFLGLKTSLLRYRDYFETNPKNAKREQADKPAFLLKDLLTREVNWNNA